MSEFHLRVLRLFGESPAHTQRVVSRRLNISLGKVNQIISSLVRDGCIVIKKSKRADNRLLHTYILTPKGIVRKMELAHELLDKKTKEYESLGRFIDEIKLDIHSFSRHSEEGRKLLEICQNCASGSRKDDSSYCLKEACYSYLTKCIQRKALEVFLEINTASADEYSDGVHVAGRTS